MTQNARWSQLSVLLVAASLMLVPATALATHNSHGVLVEVMEPDEVVTGTGPDAGTLRPDVPSDTSPGADEDHPYVQHYHNNLKTPREHPADQTGERYTACETYGQAGDANYDPASNENQCYVGYLDGQQEYLLYGDIGILNGFGDFLYPANPSSDDAFCTGEENPSQHSGPSVDQGGPGDQAIARVERGLTSPDCTGEDHNMYSALEGDYAIDQDLVELATQSDRNGPGLTSVTGTDEGSGFFTLPLLTREYGYLFGQPHPDNPQPSGIIAGEGVFGPNPAAGGSPIGDLTNACGDRTQACQLLEPIDLKLYDRYPPSSESERSGEARFCTLAPQFVDSVGGSTGPCGVFGETMFEYRAGTAGGLGVDGAPDTFIATLPGWFGFYYLNQASITVPIGFTDQYVSDTAGLPFITDDTDGSFDDGNFLYYVVNPKVDTKKDPLWCVRPNFLAEGTGAGEVSASEDPGLYGPYLADAIDSDVYTHALLDQLRQARDATHQPARSVISPAEGLAEDATATANDLADQALPDPLPELVDRADYVESANTEADNQVNNTEHDFEQTLEAGLGCTPRGTVEFRDAPKTLYGGVQFDAALSRQTVSLKDPTVLDGGLPAEESTTHEGAWQPDVYDFDGMVRGKFDSNQDDDFDGCAPADGQPHPEDDLCPWEPLWDVYNPACAGEGDQKCGEIATGLGYDVAGTDTDEASGVGLYFTLVLTGPFLLVDEDAGFTEVAVLQDRTTLVGDDDPTAQHCVIGTSTGFLDHLPEHVGTDTGPGDATLDEDDEAALCGDVSGEIVVVEDAFDDQPGSNRGTYSAAVEWIKLAPTPQGVTTATGGLGSGDSLCVNGVWTVQDGTDVTGDSTGSARLDGVGDPYTFSDCDSFETGTGPTEQE